MLVGLNGYAMSSSAFVAYEKERNFVKVTFELSSDSPSYSISVRVASADFPSDEKSKLFGHLVKYYHVQENLIT